MFVKEAVKTRKFVCLLVIDLMEAEKMFVLKSDKIKKKTKIVIVNIFVKNRLKKRSKEALKTFI